VSVSSLSTRDNTGEAQRAYILIFLDKNSIPNKSFKVAVEDLSRDERGKTCGARALASGCGNEPLLEADTNVKFAV
jgi:hypothetical protein